MGLGSSEMVTTESHICCDVCEPVCPYKNLTFPRVPEARKTTLRKRALPQNTWQMMESKLLAQRDAVVEGNPALKMFPKSHLMSSRMCAPKVVLSSVNMTCNPSHASERSFIHLFSLLLQAYVADI